MASSFELADIIADGERSAFEPRVPDLVGPSSFAFVRTTGVRYAPELLVVELFREIFFDPFTPKGEIRERQLSPDDAEFTKPEKAILLVARGRLKQTKHVGAEGFFAPIYPEQARAAWFRKKSDRALRQHLLQGAIAQALKSNSDADRQNIAETIVDALRGRLSAGSPAGVSGKEILSAAVAAVCIDGARHGMVARDVAVSELAEAFRTVEVSGPAASVGEHDALACRIKDDFVALCGVEGELPRLLWLELLKCFLRLAIPAWVLAQMKIAVLLRDWSIGVIEGQQVPSLEEIKKAIAGRGRGLFHPTRTGSNELALHVERYMKARVELNLLLYLLKRRGNEQLFKSSLSIESPGGTLVTIEELLQLMSAIPRRDEKHDKALFRRSLIRSAETFGAWANPLRKGQGKNIDEFLRSLRRFEPAEADSGYLAVGVGPGQAIVFPGPAMIRLVLLLAALAKNKRHAALRGKLVLEDLERHFQQYGLEFSASAGARPHLIAELARLGLLKGSPDAGDYTELLVPIEFAREDRSPARAVVAGNL